MTLIYARFIVGTQPDSSDPFGVRAGFRCRRVQAGDKAGALAVDQGRGAWPEFEVAAPLTARAAGPEFQDSKTFVLQKEPGGSWFFDRWTADGAGAVRAANPTFPAANEQSPANDLCGSCFIIEIGHAAR